MVVKQGDKGRFINERSKKRKEGNMNALIKLINSFRINKSDMIFEEILSKLKNYIMFYLIDIKEEQDELQQIYRIEILNITNKFRINEYVKINDISVSKIKALYQKEEKEDSYLKDFIERYGLDKFIKILTSSQEKETIYKELNLYINERALVSYMSKRFYYLKKDFIKWLIKTSINASKSLNCLSTNALTTYKRIALSINVPGI